MKKKTMENWFWFIGGISVAILSIIVKLPFFPDESEVIPTEVTFSQLPNIIFITLIGIIVFMLLDIYRIKREKYPVDKKEIKLILAEYEQAKEAKKSPVYGYGKYPLQLILMFSLIELLTETFNYLEIKFTSLPIGSFEFALFVFIGILAWWIDKRDKSKKLYRWSQAKCYKVQK